MANKTTLYIVGLGPGHKDYVLPIAIKTLETVQAVVGFPRAMESLDYICNQKVIINTLKELKELYESNKYESLGIIASGDPCYYGITNYVKNNICDKVKIIPGISSFQYLSSKIAMPWQEAHVGSMHGREEDFLNIVKSHKLSYWLVDNKYTPDVLCSRLLQAGIEGIVYVGENLSYNDEKIFKGTIKETSLKKFSSLSVLVVARD